MLINRIIGPTPNVIVEEEMCLKMGFLKYAYSVKDLRKHWDDVRVLKHFVSGKLYRWLILHGESTLAKQIKELEKEDNEYVVLNRLCNIFAVPFCHKKLPTLQSLRKEYLIKKHLEPIIFC